MGGGFWSDETRQSFPVRDFDFLAMEVHSTGVLELSKGCCDR
jgi:hypothetical protein